uniref:Ribonuclease n=1 Tax=Erythrolamprus poecilogyrus TaxID=338838 RepID=I0BWS6_ERYPO|nr:ribonuclease [Erythrolamprus poecilogyrus]
MTAKGIHVLCMLFSFAWIVLESEATTFDYNKNIDFPRTTTSRAVNYCDNIIRAKNITNQKYNVFIHEPENDIKNLCPDGYTGPVRTPELHVTLCRYLYGYLVITGRYPLAIYCENGLITEYSLTLRLGGKL